MSSLLIYVSVSLAFASYTPSTRINFGSCNHQDRFTTEYTKIWKSIVERNPDIWIWTGDAVYLDVDLPRDYPYSDYNILLYAFQAFILGKPPSYPPSGWRKKFQNLNKNVPYQYLKNSTAIIGMYDDHDMGANNVDFTWEHKDFAQQLYLDFLQVHENDSRRFQEGLYDFYELETEINVNNMTYMKTIDIIMLDTRYFLKQDGEEDVLGAVQWEWFEDVLKHRLNGELLVVVSGFQMIPSPPLLMVEGWYAYEKSQQRLFKLLKKYNTNDRLLLVSGDVHRAEIMHSQCNEINETYDFYEVTSSGLTHSVFFETPMVERFTYALDNYAREDGVMGCNWLGRNFGEINVNWYYDNDKNDVKIKNVSVEIRDENGNIKCMLYLPLFGASELHKYNSDSHYLFRNKFHTCYGAETFHTAHGVRSVQAICGLSWIIMVMYPNIFLLMFCFGMSQSIAAYCCNKLDIVGLDKPPSLPARGGIGGASIHKNNPKIPRRNNLDDVEFVDQRAQSVRSNTHTKDPSLMNPNGPTLSNANSSLISGLMFHSHLYYMSYGYLIFKNKYYFYGLITLIFVIGFKLLGPYNTEYAGNIYVVVSFGILYCCGEICLGLHCVYPLHIAKNACIATCCICGVCIIISWVYIQEILISMLFVLADCISICSSLFIISHGSMNKTYLLIIIFQFVVLGHKVYSLGSHLIYIHNEVPNHTSVGWFWLVSTCLLKIYLCQFIFRAKMQFITDMIYDDLLIQRKKYKTFEIFFPIIVFIIFFISAIYMIINTNPWSEGHVSVGTFLEFSFMFNWPSVVWFIIWFGLKRVKIPKSNVLFRKQLTFKRISVPPKIHANVINETEINETEMIETEMIETEINEIEMNETKSNETETKKDKNSSNDTIELVELNPMLEMNQSTAL